jgi:hypothetical protein
VTGCERLIADALVTDALDRGTKLAAQVALDGRLQLRVPVEPELHRKAHDGRRARPGRLGDVGDGPESHEVRRGENRLADSTLRRSQHRRPLGQPLLQIHASAR